ATSPTLQRQRTLSFILHPLCFQTTVASAPPVTARLLLSEACPPFETLAVEAERTTDNRSTTRIALASPQAGRFEATVPPLVAGQTGQVTLHIRAHPRGAEPFMLVKGPWSLSVAPAAPAPSPPPAPPAANSRTKATGVVRTFLVLNSILVLVGGI